ncbi:thioesterase family protein [Pilimelia columellifera]|uniref:Fluoroacetyl-CoA-specific thioesterase-like domain-containing protein n=1 Tax=Pilimelia columellifera subsp. columellifera TaxID=706583 RepID=A0ABP6AUC9_9ACTN
MDELPSVPADKNADASPADAVRADAGSATKSRDEVPFEVGLNAEVRRRITDGDTAQAIGSGDVPVLGTPQLLALAEAATVAATARRLPSGMTTVGACVHVEHLAPTGVGRTVAAQATLAAVEGRRLIFEVSVTDGPVVVARGHIDRVLVDRQAFVASAADPR